MDIKSDVIFSNEIDEKAREFALSHGKFRCVLNLHPWV